MIAAKTIHVVSGVLVSPGLDGLFMGLRSLRGSRLMLWEFPGGQVEPSDANARSALSREWLEEIDVDVVAGERIATGVINADWCVLLELFEVRLRDVRVRLQDAPPHSCPGSLVHDATRWADPGFAVTSLPCSPGFYACYPFLRLWWEGVRRGRAT